MAQQRRQGTTLWGNTRHVTRHLLRTPSMPSYAAFLRGVMPTNAKMSELVACFEAAGFSNVRSVLGSGNLVFVAPAKATATLEALAERAMTKRLGRVFPAIVRSIGDLQRLLDQDPFAPFPPRPKAKRVVTFLRQAPDAALALPIEKNGVRILCMHGREVFTDYLASPRGPVFMQMLKQACGDACTTRTWDTLAKVIKAAGPAPGGRAS